jgi:uncharacterized protein YceH (UPF0502 family)
MAYDLDAVEVRVLGALLEKDLTTPDYYPLSLNALVNACNQKSSRDPVVQYEEAAVEQATDSLRHRGLVLVHLGGSRVKKYSHRLGELNLGRRELPLLCVLMLRGPQTLGELRGRTERMHEFSDLEEVERVLQALAERPEGPLVAKLPHQPGTKEARYAHLWSGEPVMTAATAVEPRADRLAAVEAEVAALRQELDALKQQLAGILN